MNPRRKPSPVCSRQVRVSPRIQFKFFCCFAARVVHRVTVMSAGVVGVQLPLVKSHGLIRRPRPIGGFASARLMSSSRCRQSVFPSSSSSSVTRSVKQSEPVRCLSQVHLDLHRYLYLGFTARYVRFCKHGANFVPPIHLRETGLVPAR